MATDRKTILLYSDCLAASLHAVDHPDVIKLFQKGCFLKNVAPAANWKAQAATGTEAGQGESLEDAARAYGLNVGTLDTDFDLAVLATGEEALAAADVLAQAFAAADRSTLIALLAPDGIVFYGPGFAKGLTLESPDAPDAPYSHAVAAPTVAYAGNLPVPSRCSAPIAYAALKDINYKLNEINKLKSTIQNMEAAMERKSRQPWDKHDCA